MIKPQNILVLGIGTDVGKTVVSAIFTQAWKGNYWKPVQCGLPSDNDVIRALVGSAQVLPEVYTFKEHASAHYAAQLEGMRIEEKHLEIPKSPKPLVIESSGGTLHPLRKDLIQLDLFAKWKIPAILVSKHYLGSINHSLLTLEAIHARKIPLLGIIFNGSPYPAAEEVILASAKVPCIGHLHPETEITPEIVKKYADIWKL